MRVEGKDVEHIITPDYDVTKRIERLKNLPDGPMKERMLAFAELERKGEVFSKKAKDDLPPVGEEDPERKLAKGSGWAGAHQEAGIHQRHLHSSG